MKYRKRKIGEDIDLIFAKMQQKIEQMSPDEVVSNGTDAMVNEFAEIVEIYNSLLTNSRVVGTK